MRGDDGGDHAAHRVTDEDEVVGVDAEFSGVGGDADVGECGVGIFDGMGERKISWRTPRPAVVEVENVVASAAKGLGDVEVLLVAGEAVEKHNGGVWVGSGGDVDEGVEEGAVAGELEGLEGCGKLFVGGGILIEGTGGLRGQGERCGEEGEGKEIAKGHGGIMSFSRNSATEFLKRDYCCYICRHVRTSMDGAGRTKRYVHRYIS